MQRLRRRLLNFYFWFGKFRGGPASVGPPLFLSTGPTTKPPATATPAGLGILAASGTDSRQPALTVVLF
jgi:hypothetical protein